MTITGWFQRLTTLLLKLTKNKIKIQRMLNFFLTAFSDILSISGNILKV